MQNRNYKSVKHTVEFEVAKSANEVFNHIIDLKKWWLEEYIGDEIKLDTAFVLKTGEGHLSKNKVVEFEPNKKLVWVATESLREADNFDWTGTKFIFDITPNGNNTAIKFTYDGVVFENEFDILVQVCEMVKDKFCDFIINGKTRNENFSCSISVKISAGEVIKKIGNVAEWWGVTCSGDTEKTNDKFVIKMGGDSYFNCTVEELIPNKKVVWLVTDCYMPWYSNKEEWKNNKMIFDVSQNNGITELKFTHEGLTANIECYKDCKPGWTHWITRSLFSYLTTGKGDFQQR
jgi:hypothetical protein